MAFQPLDTNHQTQIIEPLQKRRTIYDAKKGEIFSKSFIAGFGMGLGNMFATLIFFTLLLGMFLAYVQPVLDRSIQTLQQYIPGAQQEQTILPNFGQLFGIKQKE